MPIPKPFSQLSEFYSVRTTVLLLTLSLSACAHQIGGRLLREETGPVELEPNSFALYDSAGNAYEMSELAGALDAALALRPASQQLTVFVHGMGPYPEKAFADQELEGIAETFDSAVLMLHWPSWKGSWFTLSRQSALATGGALQDFWQQLQQLRNTATWRDKQWLLLAHSMGGEVMRAVSEHPHPQVFDSALIAAPETELRNHARWLSQLHLAQHTAVLINTQDAVLGFAKVSAGTERLGLGLESKSDESIELAPGVSYLVVENSNHSHKLHYKDQSEALRQLLRQLLKQQQIEQLCNSSAEDTVVVVLDAKLGNAPYCKQRISYGEG